MLSSLYNGLSSALKASSAPASTPSTPPSGDAHQPRPTTPTRLDLDCDADPECDPWSQSPFFKRLVFRGQHSAERLDKIAAAARHDKPPREPAPEECCGEACGLECVTTVWWEEEKTWRDLHPSWRQIKASLAAEEEELRRAREEDEALNDLASGTRGDPAIEIGLENDRAETEAEVMDRITSGWKG
ncbi:hypothetical protein JCM10212_004952 [Sporobolomyces blumeae]